MTVDTRHPSFSVFSAQRKLGDGTVTYDSPDIVAGHAGNVGERDGHPSKEGVYPWREEGKHDGALTHDGEASFQVRVKIK